MKSNPTESSFAKSKTTQKFAWEFTKMNEWLPLLDAFVCKELLQESPKILEIGVHRGGWLITLAENSLSTIGIGIDPYPNNEIIREAFLGDIKRRSLTSRIFLYPTWKDLATGPHGQMQFNLIHIDGVHDESNVFADLVQASNYLSDNGIIVVDDIFYHSFPGVTSATFKFILESGYSPILFTQKKIYLCKQEEYSRYYSMIENLFRNSGIPYEIDQKLTGDHSGYFQSNSIFGHSLIITDVDLSTRKDFLREFGIGRKPFSLKEVIRQFLPPFILQQAKNWKSKLA